MKHKTGKCIDCGPSSPDKPLIAGRCNPHYWKYREKVKKAKPESKKRAIYQQTLDAWFETQIMLCSKDCENCGSPLGKPTRTNIAHIVPKSIYQEVSMHPLNRWFACWQCHTDYDQWASAGKIEKLQMMPVLPIVLKRFSSFSDQILKVNRYRLPEFLTKTANNAIQSEVKDGSRGDQSDPQ